MRAKAASSSFHALSVAQVMKLVKASPAGVGLTSAEAALRKQKEGGNATEAFFLGEIVGPSELCADLDSHRCLTDISVSE